jgi:hypothetical protein
MAALASVPPVHLHTLALNRHTDFTFFVCSLALLPLPVPGEKKESLRFFPGVSPDLSVHPSSEVLTGIPASYLTSYLLGSLTLVTILAWTPFG